MTKSIGQKIKLRREQLKLSPLNLGKKLGVQRQRVDELERKSISPSAKMLFKVADALDAPAHYFITDCELNDVDEEVLLVKYRKLIPEKKKLAIEIFKILQHEMPS
jgi:transcriptional regulator with XRE-family HTH domain